MVYGKEILLEEKELLLNLQKGDKTAFRQFFNRYQQLVFNVCYQMCYSREEAEDIIQDVFIKAFQSIANFRGDAKLSTWLYRITVNTCLKNQNRKKLNRIVSLDCLLNPNSSEF
jgi:RNA polymerase sigma factor (sigma-70 family)